MYEEITNPASVQCQGHHVAHPELAMERLAASSPKAYTLPEEKGDEMPKFWDEKPLWMVTSDAGELIMTPVSWSGGRATCNANVSD